MSKITLSQAIKLGMQKSEISSYSELSKLSGVPIDTIKTYTSEKGKNHNPSIGFLRKISAVIDIGDYFSALANPIGNIVPKSVFENNDLSLSIVPKSKKKMSLSKKGYSDFKQNLNEKTDLTLNDDFVKIPFYDDVVASAGQGYINTESPPQYITFSKAYLREFLGIYSVKNLSIITSNGDSMLPTIPQNCNIIVEHGAPKDGEICITRIGEDLLIKRLQKFPKIRLLSDNASYEPIDLEKQEYEIIGRVICYIKRV